MYTKSNRFTTRLWLIYSILIVLLYTGYVLLDHYSLNQSFIWLSKSQLSAEDFASIEQVGWWRTMLESMIYALFIIALFMSIFRFRKQSASLWPFILWNAILFVSMIIAAFVLSFAIILPIGNAILPALLPVIVLVIVYIYQLLQFKK